MATKMVLVEIWNDSKEREDAQKLFTKILSMDDETVKHVGLTVTTVKPDGNTKTESVNWNRRYNFVEE